MIIVSQSKKEIINFDNVTTIYIQENEQENKFEIGVDTIVDYYTLGEYKTEERAKEVLQEFEISIVKTKLAQESEIFFGGMKVVPDYTIYEMPEE